jgi:polyisoprenoid-binding protein YceI
VTENAQPARAGVSAQIRGSDGFPVPEAVLTVTDGTGRQVARIGVDADGRAATEPLPAGAYTAIITASGFSPAARSAQVTTDGSAALGQVTLERVGGTAILPAPGVWTIDPWHSTIALTVRHLGIASIRGRFAELGGTIQVAEPVERSSVRAEIASGSIDTGNKMRDDHLRSASFLAVDEYPAIEYRSTGLSPRSGDRWTMHGELTLHGVRHQVDLDLAYLGFVDDPWGGRRAGFHASTDLRREDFKINFDEKLVAGIAQIGSIVRVELDLQAVQGDTLPWDSLTESG